MLALISAGALFGCGAPPLVADAPVDVFSDLYVRGGPAAEGAPPRVALTFDGPGRCTADLLAALKAPGPSLAPIRATFFWDADATESARRADPAAFARLAARLSAEQHEVALGPRALAHTADPVRMRSQLNAEAQTLAAALAAGGFAQANPPRLWRAPAEGLNLAALGRAATVDRPLLLWTRRPTATDVDGLVRGVADRLADGDVLALPSDDAGCVAVRALPLLAAALAGAGVQTVTASELLGRALHRHLPPRLARYRGAGLSEACARNLSLPASPEPAEAVVDRFGLVVGESEAVVTVLPLPALTATAAALASDGDARRAWRSGAWRGAPGCLRAVPRGRLLSPVTMGPADAPTRIWLVSDVGIEARDARALGAPDGALVLPDLTDLVRIEARQRLPWRLRGLVAGALRQLDLAVPMLVEARPSVGVVVGQALTPPPRGAPDFSIDGAKVPEINANLSEAQALARIDSGAIGGYVQLVEWTLSEYLYLARRHPAALPDLQRAARAADGFLRAGPFLVLPEGPGSAPDPARLGPDGTAPLGSDPRVLLARVLAAGHTLAPGDLVFAAPPPVVGAPEVDPPTDTDSLRAALRRGLAASVSVGFRRPDYLRPGALITTEGDQLGRQPLRVAVPPGVNAPTRDALPLVAPRPTESTR